MVALLSAGAVAVAACGDGGSASSGSSQDEIDPLVVDAVAPFNAETQLVSDRVNYQIEQQFYSEVEDCIESLGVPRIGLEFEQDPPDELIGRRLPDFPNMDVLERDGLWSLAEDDFFTDEDRNILSNDQPDAMEQCHEQESLEREGEIFDDFNMLRGS